jgi:hypothetical protein
LLNRSRRRRTPENIREEAQLLERQLLLVEELLVTAGKILLAQRLNLRSSAKLSLIDTHLLAVLLLTKTAQSSSGIQLLLKP